MMGLALTRFSAALLTLAALAACSTSTSSPAPISVRNAPSAEIPSRGLGPQTLQAGECGLFLWTKTLPNTLIFFTKAGSDSALLKTDDTVQTLTASRVGGTIFGQFMTQQTYASRGDGVVELTLEPGEVLQDGQRVENGRLGITNAEGWETIIPVLGVRACQP